MFRRTWHACLIVWVLALAACAPRDAPTSPRAAAPAAGAAPAPAAAVESAARVDTRALEDFYRGKTIRIVVGLAAGGGYDVYARMIARHFGKHIPGNPSIVVENQVGAGSLLAANAVYNTAPKDGTTIVHFAGGLITQQLIGNPAVQFDAAQFNWLGAPTGEVVACAVTKASGFNRLEEATDSRPLILGGTGPGASSADTPNVVRTALGLNIKPVLGYDGTSKVRLAAEQGETMGGCWGWPSIKVTWKDGLASGDVKVIAQGGRARHPDLPDVPLIRDLATTDEQRLLIDAGIALQGEYIRPFALPPGVPAERVQALREAFMATLRDPEFVAEAAQAQLDIDPITSEQLAQSVRDVFALSPELRTSLKAALTP